MVAPAVPEIIEDEIESAIEARNEALQTIRELGPPDLVHLIKQSKSGGRQSGVYHHVTGVDASSSASLAAYVNTMVYRPDDKTHKVVSGLYCCYNAFSHLDMRVDVKIPGGVESYCIDERGDKRVASEGLWLETFLCGVLRAYSYADDGSGDSIKKIIGVRRFDPITSTEVEHKFLEAAERLFFKGSQLGSEPEIQVPNVVSNHLTTGLLNYIHTTGRYTSGINLFEKLRTRDIEVSSLLARVLISADEEVQAVKLLHDAISEIPMDYSLMDCQSEFCKSKGRLDWALDCAKRSVTAAPSEFGTWAKLAEIYVGLEQWDLALLTLNSCPMFTYQDKDAPRMPEPARVMLPVLPESMLDEIDDSQQSYDSEMVHPSLRKLHAASYKGTFLKAYSLLTEITAKIGWDQLLKIRSQVFVMEEEYRSEKQTVISSGAASSHNASTVALHSPSPKTNGTTPTQNFSEESEVENDGDTASMATTATAVAEENGNGPRSAALEADESIEKPNHTITSEEVKSGNEEPTPPHTSYTQFRHKRLCERWLDNLFMVLYEDLRIYTIWRTDMARSKSEDGGSAENYRKSAEEWEILGELAERLHHIPEAVEAYQMCLRVRFSPKAMKGVLKMYEGQGRVNETLQSLIRLIAWQYRWYSEFSPSLLRTIRRLIESEGAVKVRSIVQATSLPQPVLDLTHRYVEFNGNIPASHEALRGRRILVAIFVENLLAVENLEQLEKEMLKACASLPSSVVNQIRSTATAYRKQKRRLEKVEDEEAMAFANISGQHAGDPRQPNGLSLEEGLSPNDMPSFHHAGWSDDMNADDQPGSAGSDPDDMSEFLVYHPSTSQVIFNAAPHRRTSKSRRDAEVEISGQSAINKADRTMDSLLEDYANFGHQMPPRNADDRRFSFRGRSGSPFRWFNASYERSRESTGPNEASESQSIPPRNDPKLRRSARRYQEATGGPRHVRFGSESANIPRPKPQD